ncbi:hypothetical protein ICE98_03665 [Lactococcus lactis]|nr:hypothetical protein [Lactococcus lactis]
MIIKQLLSVLEKNFSNASQEEIEYQFEIPKNLRQDFLLMSPLEWSVSEERKKFAKENPPKTARIHVQILVGRK